MISSLKLSQQIHYITYNAAIGHHHAMTSPTSNLSLLHDDVQFSQQMPSAPNLFYVDDGCFSGTATGWGMVVYNQMGNVVVSACRNEFIHVEPVLAEALGVRWCLQKTIEANMKDIDIASYCGKLYQL
ncbi:hypothetical protein P8452_46707 [Trifolium repens]|nr:hypothetical protein P8452_46707 [Trifolium repens]